MTPGKFTSAEIATAEQLINNVVIDAGSIIRNIEKDLQHEEGLRRSAAAMMGSYYEDDSLRKTSGELTKRALTEEALEAIRSELEEVRRIDVMSDDVWKSLLVSSLRSYCI